MHTREPTATATLCPRPTTYLVRVLRLWVNGDAGLAPMLPALASLADRRPVGDVDPPRDDFGDSGDLGLRRNDMPGDGLLRSGEPVRLDAGAHRRFVLAPS